MESSWRMNVWNFGLNGSVNWILAPSGAWIELASRLLAAPSYAATLERWPPGRYLCTRDLRVGRPTYGDLISFQAWNLPARYPGPYTVQPDVHG